MKTVAQQQLRRIRLNHGGDSFEVRITRGTRERLSISVHPDLRVTATAPQSASDAAVRKRIELRAGWICRQRAAFRLNRPLPVKRQYVSGETHLYLGRQYQLRIRVSPKEEVSLSSGYLRVTTPTPADTRRVERLVSGWISDRACIVLGERFNRCVERVRPLGVECSKLVLRPMRNRWGSCSIKGRITLNPDLIRVPTHCIEYVVIHELCHTKVMSHKPAFFRLLSQIIPDWEQRKRRLNSFVLPDTR
jgi:hypothetical protein